MRTLLRFAFGTRLAFSRRSHVRWAVGAFIGVLAWTLMGAVAGAHDPVFIADEQTTPETGPYFPDGTVSWAIYSTTHAAGETRGFEFDLVEGDRLILSVLIPNLEPEISLTEAELPTLAVEFPDGSVREIEPTIGSVFDEPFSGTSYVRLYSSREDGMAGRYRAVLTARAPVRTSIAIGDREVFGTVAERAFGRDGSRNSAGSMLNTWYSTPPGSPDERPATTLVPATDSVDSAGPSDDSGESSTVTAERSSTGESAAPTSGGAAADDVLADAYVAGPSQSDATDRLLLPMSLLAATLVLLALVKVVRGRSFPRPAAIADDSPNSSPYVGSDN